MTEPPLMEKRFVTFIVLAALILFGWFYLYRQLFPSPPAPAVTSTPPPIAGPETPGAPAPAAPPPVPPAPTSVPAVAAAASEDVRIETDLAVVVLTNAGGRVRSWRLKDYATAGRPVDFVSHAAERAGILPLSLVFDDKGILPDANRALYETTRATKDDGAETVTFRWADGAGSSIEKTIVLRKSAALADIEIKAVDRGRPVTPRVVWGPGLEVEDPENRSNTYYADQSVILDRSAILLRKRGIDKPIVQPESARLGWAGLEDQYFAALLIPAGSRAAVTIAPLAQSGLAPTGAAPEPKLLEAPTVAVSLPDGKARLFVGPKSFGMLSGVGHELEKVVWFSDYALIYACAKPLFLALRWVHDHWVSNYGLAIILLTIALRLILFPLNQYSMVKMRRVATDMQRVQPKLKALQAKYKKSNDAEARAKLNKETMELYQREGINPFGGVTGCLPLLIQMPILWAFFDVLTAAVELRGAPFAAWIDDLTHPDPIWITPILMGATMFVQQKMTPMTNVDPAQQKIMLFMPVMFTIMFMNLPAGLVLYYFVNNLLGIGQQWLVNRHVARLEAAPTKA
jgi:YidC/Oxa1 family membrane protein insertase